jgi:hypothetical protein
MLMRRFIGAAALLCAGLVVIWVAPISVLFALPWIAAIAWVGSRAGWSSLWSESDEAFPSQSSRLRGFGGR